MKVKPKIVVAAIVVGPTYAVWRKRYRRGVSKIEAMVLTRDMNAVLKIRNN